MKKPSATATPNDFLLEIGCEELPADYLPHALRSLQFSAWCQLDPGQGYRWRQIETWASPRRLVLIVRGLEAVVRWEKVGPSKAAAYDAQGHPTSAAQGFAKSQGVPLSVLQVKETPKGPCVVAQRAEPVASMLTTAVPAIIEGIQFPKRMRWGDGRTAFARPLRWLVALHGRQIVPCEIAGLSSERRSAALRRARTPWLSLASVADYLRAMQRAEIVLERLLKPTDYAPLPPPGEWASLPADPNPPKTEALRRKLVAVARAAGGQLDTGEEFEELLATATFLAEQPVVEAGAFRLEYLTLPSEVLATAMAKHLKAFSVRDAQGQLLPKFLVVLEGKPTNLRVVMANYERILEARFTDAQFFWREDTRTPLADKVAPLAGVMFNKQLGMMAENTARLETVAQRVRGRTDTALSRAILLAKADLVTQMVREFPTLQGVMGSEYAKHDGESAEVIQALREQYAPRTTRDPLPVSDAGTWLSLLNRANMLTGFFGVGLAPTSSEDPYGLRRQALGLVRILVEKPLPLSLDTFLTAALESWGARLTKPLADVRHQLRAFLLDRFRWWAGEQRYPRELVDAVLAAATDDLADARRRLDALHALWRDPARRQQVLFRAGKVVERTGRMVQSAKEPDVLGRAVDPSKFTAPEERQLWETWTGVKTATADWLTRCDYTKASETYGTLYPALHQFFEKVFIMDENPDVRRNRLAMMREIYDLYANRVGDLSKLPLPNDL